MLWLEDGQFKAMAMMATDPVCGMSVQREKATTGEWGGRTFHFCSRGCKAEFMVDPETFARAEPPTPVASA